MGEQDIDVAQVRKYWLPESEDALRVAGHLIEKGDYSYALFFGHLAIEKMLKAILVSRRGEHAPPIHNLVRLARMADLRLDSAREEFLLTISSFNIEARYPDLKRSFRAKCTAEFADKQMNVIKELYQWLRSQLP